MKMTKEIFESRLLQMSIERDAINALIQGMVAQNVVRECNGGGEPDYTMKEFDQAKHSLMALGRGIDNLINEYQAGVSAEEKYALPRLYTAEEMHRAYDWGRESYMLNMASGESDAAFERFIKSLEGTGK